MKASEGRNGSADVGSLRFSHSSVADSAWVDQFAFLGGALVWLVSTFDAVLGLTVFFRQLLYHVIPTTAGIEEPS
jgi:hypothetical protein